jgi:hypothetical protein
LEQGASRQIVANAEGDNVMLETLYFATLAAVVWLLTAGVLGIIVGTLLKKRNER